MPHYRVHNDPRSSHQQISNLARGLRRSPVLDVGCAQGIIGHLIRDLGLTVDGVEASAEWAQLARESGAYRTVWANLVEDAPLPPRTYQLVICGDILEHTPSPVSVLKKLREAATEDATFIISVPNVAHLAIRLMLLFGKFPKMDRGILDRTHLQYHTKDTALDMLKEAGLRVTKVSCTGVPLDELWKGGEGTLIYRAMMRSQHLALAALPRVFGFQWIFVAEPAR
jgi:2-polyprenyl-3-methyl-5-hydroxy-6-metoxy-1,4-benzoquinol methylase